MSFRYMSIDTMFERYKDALSLVSEGYNAGEAVNTLNGDGRAAALQEWQQRRDLDALRADSRQLMIDTVATANESTARNFRGNLNGQPLRPMVILAASVARPTERAGSTPGPRSVA